MIDRRRFLLGSASVGAALAWPLRLASAAPGTGPYGPLQAPNADGLALPAGFTGRAIATTGQAVAGYSWHENPDGGAAFPAAGGGWTYVSNRESVAGGASSISFDASGAITGARSILSGTVGNCAGGPTPWGTWLSCEEHPLGMVWECDPLGATLAVPRPAMGRFQHEAATVDPVRRVVYLTEDQPDGGLYRFVPTSYPDLGAGRLDVFTTSGWAAVPDASGAGTATRDQVPSMIVFAGGEGAWFDGARLWFTTKHDNKVWQLDPTNDAVAAVYDVATSPTPVLSGVDNVTVSVAGDAFVCEDGGNMEIVILSREGEVAPFLRVDGTEGSELTGVAFNPSGNRMYFSSQRNPGRTYEVTGPFRGRAAAPAPVRPSRPNRWGW